MSTTFPAHAENGASGSRSARAALACSVLALGAELAYAVAALALGTDAQALDGLTAAALTLPVLGVIGFFLGLHEFQQDARARTAQLAAWLGATAMAGPWILVLASLVSWVITGE